MLGDGLRHAGEIGIAAGNHQGDGLAAGLPASNAASAAAPPGSTSNLSLWAAKATARSSSASLTARPGASKSLAASNTWRPASAPSGHRRWRACRPAPVRPRCARQRAPHAVEILRLDAVHRRGTPAPFKPQRDAADQPAAAAGRQHRIQRHAADAPHPRRSPAPPCPARR